jgi:hypothetical protein
MHNKGSISQPPCYLVLLFLLGTGDALGNKMGWKGWPRGHHNRLIIEIVMGAAG